ncbi:MAG: metal ABC transporter permease [Calditerrivibrio sp.]|nr:metal ABC transporter permease [Calditerrivibrio sp.]
MSFDFFDYIFIKNALMGIVLISALCGIIGSIIVVNRIVSLAGSISHAAYGGVGLSFYFGLPVQLTTMLFSSIAGLIIGLLSEREESLSDSLISIIWAFGMALGIILTDLTPGYNADLMTYLFGNILTITTQDLIITSIMNTVSIISLILFYDKIVLISFDRDYARVIGINVKMLNLIIFVFISIAIIVLIKMTGIILVMAMLTIPQNIAIKRCRSLISMIIYSFILSLCFSLIGFFIAYKLNLSTGATIIMFSTIIYMLDVAISYVRRNSP